MDNETNQQNYNQIDAKKAFYADMATIVGAMLWGGEFVAIKYALIEFSPLLINAFRFGLGFIILAMIFFKKMKTLDQSYIKAGLILGVFAFIGFTFMTVAIQYTQVAVNAFLVATYTIWVPLISSIIYKKRPHWTLCIASLLCMTGIYFLTADKGEIALGFGELFSLLAAISFSFLIILKAHYIKRKDPIGITIAQSGATGAYYTIAVLVWESLPVYNGNFASITAIFYIVIGATVIAHLIVNTSLKYTTANRQVIMISLESVFASLFAFFLLKEDLTFSILLGTLFIFLAIIIVETELKFLAHFKKKNINL